MSRIRSKRLYEYLERTGAFAGTEENIARAKAEYRKQYKRNWKKTSRKKRELRPTFTEKEYAELFQRAQLLGLTPTAYLRELVLTNQENRELIPHREELLSILQKMSMALMDTSNCNIYLHEAEQMLLTYLRNH